MQNDFPPGAEPENDELDLAQGEPEDTPSHDSRRVWTLTITALLLLALLGASFYGYRRWFGGSPFSEEVLYQAAVHETCHLASHGRIIRRMMEDDQTLPKLKVVFPRNKPGDFKAYVNIESLSTMVNAGYPIDEPWYLEGLLAGDAGTRLFFEDPTTTSVQLDMRDWETNARSYLSKGKEPLPWFNAPSNVNEALVNSDTLKILRQRQTESVKPFLKRNEALILEFAKTLKQNSGADHEECLAFIRQLKLTD